MGWNDYMDDSGTEEEDFPQSDLKSKMENDLAWEYGGHWSTGCP